MIRGTNRWCIAIYGPTEMFCRVWGFGFAIRNHRKIKPYFSERYKKRGHYLHIGHLCFAYLGREHVA